MKTIHYLSIALIACALPAVAAEKGASVKGSAKFKGDVPRKWKPATEEMKSDAACTAAHGGKPVVLDDGVILDKDAGIKNVFVYVKKGLEGKKFEPPKTPVVLNQTGCAYEPHVFGIMVGQELQIKNSDPTLHNVHAIPKKNAEFNQSQPAKAADVSKHFAMQEVPAEIKCDIHSWMKCYAGVVSHPYFAVTGENGSFEIKDLPPGEYEIEAWHSKAGRQTKKIKVEAGKEVPPLQFDFSAETQK